jgi:polyphosphate glucokinase
LKGLVTFLKSRDQSRALNKINVLVVDVGGTHVKILASDADVRREFASGKKLTAKRMVENVKDLAADWPYDVVAIGYPGPVLHQRIAAEPHNLGPGWVGFDFAVAFGRPVKLINDAAMQALGGYRGGRMLFLGFGTGLGSAMIVEGIVEPMELGHLAYKKHDYEHYVGAKALARMGKKKWRKHVLDVIESLRAALEPEEVLLGGGNASEIEDLPPGCRRGDNADAFAGGFRLWDTAAANFGPAGSASN